MNKNNNKTKKEGIIYDMYGIFNDYLIDTNQFMEINGPVFNYENFQVWRKWEVAKIEIEGKPFLIVDIDLKPFSYSRCIQHGKIVLKNALNSEEAIAELRTYSRSTGINILDQMDFYLKVISRANSKDTSSKGSNVGDQNLAIDEDTKDLMICRIIEEGKADRIGLVRDIFGDGYLEENEIRIDGNYYNEEEGINKVKELCQELGLEPYNL